MDESYELISYKTCPFVQRCVILFLEKGIEIKISYIDLKHKPEWFLQLSPLGKVPVLKINGKVLFESLVINEYIDEVHLPKMQPPDPFQRARNRAFSEFAGNLQMQFVQATRSKSQKEYEDLMAELRHKLMTLEKQMENSPYFNGENFCLVDVAYAPFFMRIREIEKLHPLYLLEMTPKVKLWGEKLLERDSVKESVVPDFSELLLSNFYKYDSYLSRLIESRH